MLERGFEKAKQHRENKNPVKQFAIHRAIEMLKAAGVVDSPLETVAHSAAADKGTKSEAPKVDLRQQMIDLLHFLVEPTDDEKRELREKRGLVFLPMTSQSYAQVVAEAPNHFWDKELEYANARPGLRGFLPPVAVEVGLIEGELALPGSFRKSCVTALQMIDEYSKVLATEFPGFMAIALPVTGYANADKAYAERNPGQVLFKNYFAWGLDNLSGSNAVSAGRDDPSFRFSVLEWRADRGYGNVGAVPAVVKIDNK